MRYHQLIAVAVLLAFSLSGCPKKETAQPQKKTPTTTTPQGKPPDKLPAGALAPDKEFAQGEVQAVEMAMETRLEIPGLGPENPSAEVKKAQEESATKQTWVVSEERGKLSFDTEKFIVPAGTEIRYNPAHKKYVLVDAQKKQYWAMSGAEMGNLLEGGPSAQRSNYAITIKDTEESATVAGKDARRTDAQLSFDWKVKTKDGAREGKVKVNLAIWHTQDETLKPAWGRMIVDFLTVPFQDPEGQKVVEQLKSKVNFPVKWAMEVVNEGQKKEAGEVHPKLVTEAKSLKVAQANKADLATPPQGSAPAAAPYQFGEGGQQISEELLGMLPAQKGDPPQGATPPEEK